jgi:hypothetical protein
MAFSLSRWRPWHLIVAWIAYWIALIVVGLGTPLRMILGGLAAPPGQGAVNASFSDGMVSLVVKAGASSYTGSASLLSVALWVAIPPLLLFVLWAATRSSPAAARERIS